MTEDKKTIKTVQMLGKFVTARLKGQIDPRQGWVVCESPLLIRGQSGIVYECEGTPVEVINPPNKLIKEEENHDPLSVGMRWKNE